MLRKTFSGLILIVLLTGILTSIFNIQPVKAGGTIYIRADGSVEGTDKIQREGNVYTFTDNIFNQSTVVERSNIIIAGNGHTLQGTGYPSRGMYLYAVKNVTIENINIKGFNHGIYLDSIYTSHNVLSRNTITENEVCGVYIMESSDNTISGNTITGHSIGIYLDGDDMYPPHVDACFNNSIYGNTIANNIHGIYLADYSKFNNIYENNITGNRIGIKLHFRCDNNIISGNIITASNSYGIHLRDDCDNNTISGNTITGHSQGGDMESRWAILLEDSNKENMIIENTIANNNVGVYTYYSSNSSIYHNKFINNTDQVLTDSVNIWDDGYPSGGNYWSDYNGTDLCSGPFQNETGSDGIGDTIYFIDENNTDNYPLMKPYPWGPHDIGITNITTSKTVVGQGYSLHINITMFNYGNNTENFNVTVYANTTIIYVFENVTLTSRNSTTITFTWNTTDWIKGNYTISANATAVPGETDFSDNNFTGGWVFVTIQGDVDGDRDVDIYDVVKITGIYGSKRGDPQFNPNSDLDDDGEIKIYDVVRCTSHYGQSWQP